MQNLVSILFKKGLRICKCFNGLIEMDLFANQATNVYCLHVIHVVCVTILYCQYDMMRFINLHH